MVKTIRIANGKIVFRDHVEGNVPDEQMQGIISIVCPQMISPYLRAIVSDVCTRAGFPPIILSEVNFQAMFEAQQAQAAAQNGNGGSRIITGVN